MVTKNVQNKSTHSNTVELKNEQENTDDSKPISPPLISFIKFQ